MKMKKKPTLLPQLTFRAVLVIGMATLGTYSQAQSGPDPEEHRHPVNVDSLKTDLEQKRLAIEAEWKAKNDSIKALMDANAARWKAQSDSVRAAWEIMAKDSLPTFSKPNYPVRSVNVDSVKAEIQSQRDSVAAVIKADREKVMAEIEAYKALDKASQDSVRARVEIAKAEIEAQRAAHEAEIKSKIDSITQSRKSAELNANSRPDLPIELQAKRDSVKAVFDAHRAAAEAKRDSLQALNKARRDSLNAAFELHKMSDEAKRDSFELVNHARQDSIKDVNEAFIAALKAKGDSLNAINKVRQDSLKTAYEDFIASSRAKRDSLNAALDPKTDSLFAGHPEHPQDSLKAIFKAKQDSIKAVWEAARAAIKEKQDSLTSAFEAKRDSLFAAWNAQKIEDSLRANNEKGRRDSLKFEFKKSFVSPNPAPQNGGMLNVENTSNETLNFYVIDAAGNIYLQKEFNGEQIEMPTLKPGFYHYKIVNSNGDVISRGKFFVHGA